MNRENIAEWQATPAARWWETPSRWLGLIVYIGCRMLLLLFGAFAPGHNTWCERE